MQIIIAAKPAKARTARKMQRLNRRKLIGTRQDSIDGVDENVGPNRGNEAVFDK
jgi:hypothetical protein